MGGAEGTKLDDDFMEMERVSKSIFSLIYLLNLDFILSFILESRCYI